MKLKRRIERELLAAGELSTAQVEAFGQRVVDAKNEASPLAGNEVEAVEESEVA